MLTTSSPLRFTAFTTSLAVVLACGEPTTTGGGDDHQTDVVEYDTNRVCDDGVPPYTLTIERHLTETGPTGNDITTDSEAVWLVESDANTVSRLVLDDESFQSGHIDVGTERNPYGLAVDDDTGEVWITNYLSETVTIADIDTGNIIKELDEDFARPSAVVVTEDYAYVGNVDFRGSDQGYGPGYISVIDRHTMNPIERHETTFQNPHFLTIESIDGDDALFVTSSGAVIWDGERTRVESEGGLEWFDIAVDPVEPPSEAFKIGQKDTETTGAPGRPALTPDGNELYFASGIAPVVFAFDLDSKTWKYNANTPLRLYDADGDTTHRAAMGPDGLLWVTAYNEDQLHLLDTACDQSIIDPIDVGKVPDMLEGPQAVTVVEREDRIDGYYLLNIANALGRISVQK